MDGDDFEWDGTKAEANLRKHRISFRAASRVFDDPLVAIEQDLSEDYGEDRFYRRWTCGLPARGCSLYRARRLHPDHFSAQGECQ
jgi:uncharacterized DUF497 family protein